MAFLGANTPYAFVIAFLVVMASGQILFQPSNNMIIMSSVLPNKLGVAGSVNSLVRNLGLITGITFSTTLLYALMTGNSGHAVTDYPTGNDTLFIHAVSVIYVIIGLVAFAGAILTFMRFAKHKRTAM